MLILNLGCGNKTCSSKEIVNIDWSVYLVLKSNAFLRPLSRPFISGERRKRFDQLPDNILVHDLSKGIPYKDGSADAVYLSHVFEHLDKHVASSFLQEIKRVLRPAGVLRIVVPDLEFLCRKYLRHLELCDRRAEERRSHDRYIAEILEQMVRKEAYGTSQQGACRRWLENWLLGDARKRGETHQWMYDRVNLGDLLETQGFSDQEVMDYDRSRIPDWNGYALDMDASGKEYKPGSLYMEATK